MQELTELYIVFKDVSSLETQEINTRLVKVTRNRINHKRVSHSGWLGTILIQIRCWERFFFIHGGKHTTLPFRENMCALLLRGLRFSSILSTLEFLLSTFIHFFHGFRNKITKFGRIFFQFLTNFKRTLVHYSLPSLPYHYDYDYNIFFSLK